MLFRKLNKIIKGESNSNSNIKSNNNNTSLRKINYQRALRKKHYFKRMIEDSWMAYENGTKHQLLLDTVTLEMFIYNEYSKKCPNVNISQCVKFSPLGVASERAYKNKISQVIYEANILE